MRDKGAVLLVLALLVASGCGGGGDDETTAAGPADDAEVEETSDGEDAAGDGEFTLAECRGTPGPDPAEDADAADYISDPTLCLSTGGGAFRADFNGDGFSDLAIGSPYADVAGVVDAGAVYVFYGGEAFDGRAPQLITQGADGVADTPEEGDRFGFAVTVLDLDCSGKSDLVIGAPFEDVGDAVDAGAFHVLFGQPGVGLIATPTGFASPPNFWTQDTGKLREEAESGDLFGYSFAWGNMYAGEFNDRGFAIGAPGEDVGPATDAGAVHVLRANCEVVPDRGLTDVGNLVFTQDTAGLQEKAEAGDHFGSTMVSGLVTLGIEQTSPAYLAIGVPGEDVGRVRDAGGVHVLPASPTGPSPEGSQFWTQASQGIGESAEAGDQFGETMVPLGAGLAIGVPREDVVVDRGGTSLADAGIVHFLPGSGGVLTTQGSVILTQGSASGDPATEKPEAGDMFGSSLAVGRFRGQGEGDHLAIGAPFEDFEGRPTLVDAGVVHVIPIGFNAATAIVLRQSDTPGQAAASGNLFGFGLSAWDFDSAGSQRVDLAVGAPGTDVAVPSTRTTLNDAGVVLVYVGGEDGLPASAAHVLDAFGIGTGPSAGDQFGMAMY